MADIGNALERLAPSIELGQQQFAFTSADIGAAQLLTFHNPAAVAGFEMIKSGALYISVKTTADVHLVFGPSVALTAAVTNANAVLLQAADGIQDWLLMPGWNAVRFKGDAGSGTLYIWPSGR